MKLGKHPSENGDSRKRFKVVVVGQCCDVTGALQNVGSMPSRRHRGNCAVRDPNENWGLFVCVTAGADMTDYVRF